jgi:cholesterol oxidase
MTAGPPLSFREMLQGFLGEGPDHESACADGRRRRQVFRYRALATINDLAAFEADPDHPVALEGTIDYAPLGLGLPLLGGSMNLFVDRPAGRRILYHLPFEAPGGRFVVVGEKRLAGKRRWQEMTTLYADLYHPVGQGDSLGEPVARGILRVRLRVALALPLTIRSPGRSPVVGLGAAVRFLRFSARSLRR